MDKEHCFRGSNYSYLCHATMFLKDNNMCCFRDISYTLFKKKTTKQKENNFYSACDTKTYINFQYIQNISFLNNTTKKRHSFFLFHSVCISTKKKGDNDITLQKQSHLYSKFV